MNQKGFVLGWIVLGILILGGVLAGAYYLKLSNKTKLSSLPSSNLTLKDESLDWQEYKNQTFGYLIKFPDLYEISPQSEKQTSQLGFDTNICFRLKANKVCKIVINSYKNTSNLSVEKWVQQFRPTNKIIGKVKLGDYEVLSMEGISPLNYYLTGNDIIYEISSPKGQLEEKIISTFRVLVPDEKLNWKSYQVEGLYAIKYPDDLYGVGKGNQYGGKNPEILSPGIVRLYPKGNDSFSLSMGVMENTQGFDSSNPRQMFGKGPVIYYPEGYSNNFQIKTTNIDGVTAFRVDADDGLRNVGSLEADILLIKGSRVYELLIEGEGINSGGKLYKQTVEEMIKTFRFFN